MATPPVPGDPLFLPGDSMDRRTLTHLHTNQQIIMRQLHVQPSQNRGVAGREFSPSAQHGVRLLSSLRLEWRFESDPSEDKACELTLGLICLQVSMGIVLNPTRRHEYWPRHQGVCAHTCAHISYSQLQCFVLCFKFQSSIESIMVYSTSSIQPYLNCDFQILPKTKNHKLILIWI